MDIFILNWDILIACGEMKISINFVCTKRLEHKFVLSLGARQMIEHETQNYYVYVSVYRWAEKQTNKWFNWFTYV